VEVEVEEADVAQNDGQRVVDQVQEHEEVRDVGLAELLQDGHKHRFSEDVDVGALIVTFLDLLLAADEDLDHIEKGPEEVQDKTVKS
jgi:hypothetical protein